jgi:hypothetical protein
MSDTTTRIPPPAPGFYENVPFNTYLAWDAVSRSVLKQETPLHMNHARTAAPEKPTEAMVLGQAFHTLLLEPDAFEARSILGPVNERTGKSYGRGTLAWDAFEAMHPDKIVVSGEEVESLSAMIAACRKHPSVARLMGAKKLAVEVSAVWVDPEFGVTCKGRFDALARIEAGYILPDFKTCRYGEAADSVFGRAAHRYGYDFQFAHYVRGVNTLRPGVKVYPFVFACEKDAPYAVAVKPVEDDTLAVGTSSLRNKLRLFSDGMKSGNWPGYEESPLRLPEFAYRQIESEGING